VLAKLEKIPTAPIESSTRSFEAALDKVQGRLQYQEKLLFDFRKELA
jgi:hypothetical protein